MVCEIFEVLKSFHEGTNCRAFEIFGCHKYGENKYVFRVWAPHAERVDLVGKFNGEREVCLKMDRLPDGESFEVVTSAQEGDVYAFLISTYDGRKIYKADPYAFYSDLPNSFYSKICDLPTKAIRTNEICGFDKPVNIYEVNLLSWKRHDDNSYYSYRELEKTLVPYVKSMGYTHVEFMPVNEFPYDGSWGYQVTGYFSVTSRLGTPSQFKSLVDAFHSNGIKVIIDWVPAHFPKDDWGLYEFDGQPLYECPLWDRMEHSGWGTRKFDFGRGEIDSFLLSAAVMLMDVYGADGLRVDAVASMLYLDYDRCGGDWTPNIYGDSRNLEAIELLKKINATLKKLFPDAVIIAEESTAFPKLTDKIENGGLGFDYKWNMGWMNDVLFYCRQDPYFRNHHHNKLTFSLVYAFSEKFILPLSHDEVVHVKGSVVNKMPGSYDDKFAGERLLLGFMYAHPGKKLNFMGYEIAQFSEWNYCKGIDFFLTEYEKHRKMRAFVKAINFFYLNNKPLYEIDDSWDGFEWLVVDDRTNNFLAFNRYSRNGDSITAVMNFSGIDLHNYRFGIEEGKYTVIFNSDLKKFGGCGSLKKRIFKSENLSSHGKEHSLCIDIPKLTCMFLKKIN